MTCRLLSGRILIRPIPKRMFSTSGRVALTETYQDDQAQYQVIGIGPPKLTKKGHPIDPEVRPGQFVLTDLHAQHHSLPDGTKIIGFEQLLAVWNAE
jgi:co-chaperonin GroES (HSP10)